MRGAKKGIVALSAIALSLGFSQKSNAANIRWDCFWQTGGGSEFEVCWYEQPDIPAWAYMYVTVSASSGFVTITPTDYALLVGDWKWVVAKPGDVASESTIKHNNEYFIRDKKGTEGPYLGESVTAVWGTSVYMMVMVEMMPDEALVGQDVSSMPPYFYGWVELQVGQDGVVRLASSALDLEGGAMIVGGGSATPEPSSALLLLIGGAALALTRRGRG